MANFAKINKDGIVEWVIPVANEDCGGGEFPQSEAIGQAFIAERGLEGLWLQTSYNANFRGKFASIGDKFENDEFVSTREIIEEDEQLG
jgi:hypothetical protein